MGRMGGGSGGSGAVGGGSQSNQPGGDSKDIRRRVSHNEGELSLGAAVLLLLTAKKPWRHCNPHTVSPSGTSTSGPNQHVDCRALQASSAGPTGEITVPE